jgi:hypothetical protein
MTRTPTLPPDDKRMWRQAKARAHPDTGDDHELFIWLGSVKELVCNGTARPKPESEPPRRPPYWSPAEEPTRVPYPPGTDFREATRRALWRAASTPDACGGLLSLLEDCYPLDRLWREQERGASYKRLAAIGHMVGMDVAERSEWYRVAEEIPLADRHAGHILKRLKERAA